MVESAEKILVEKEALEEIDMAQLAISNRQPRQSRHSNRLDESLRLGLRLRVLLPLRAARLRSVGRNRDLGRR